LRKQKDDFMNDTTRTALPSTRRLTDGVRRAIERGEGFSCTAGQKAGACLGRSSGWCLKDDAPRCDRHVAHAACLECGGVLSFADIREAAIFGDARLVWDTP
jgi:hypothetical protein